MTSLATSMGASPRMEKDGFLDPHDLVGSSFYIAENTMLAFTMFFFFERGSVPARWRTSMTIAGMVTAIAAWNYNYMRSIWVTTQSSPTVYRYTDWLITVPLLMVEFFMVLRATTNCSEGIFWRIFNSSIVMLLGGYLGETGMIPAIPGFCIGMAAYLFLLNELFNGECSQVSASCGSTPAKKCYNTLRFFVSVCWLIYPAGYAALFIGNGAVSIDAVNILYNLADLVNKGFFGLAVYAAAVEEGGRSQ